MKVSIVVPNFNYAKYLPACLDSIAVQTYQNIEVLLADGGSTDGSIEILESYSARYGWEIFSRSDAGQVDAIARGLEKSSGDIQCWLNSDDFFISNKAVEIAVSTFQEFPTLDIASLGGYYTNEVGYWLKPITPHYHPLFQQTEIALRGGFVQPATFWKPYVFEKIGLNHTFRFVFDQHFFIQAYKQFNMLINQNVKLAGYRLHGQNLSIGVKPERIRELAVSNRHFFGLGFRYLYLQMISFLATGINYFPKPLAGKLNSIVRIINNLLSYLTLYRIPSI